MLSKGYIKNQKSGKTIKFQFNPSDYTSTRGTNFREISSPGTSYPRFQFVSGGARQLRFDVFLYDDGPENFIKFMQEFLPPEDSSKGFKHPPLMTVAFGNMVKTCLLENLEERYNEFNEDLSTKHAILSLTLKVVS